ncbi:MAG: arylamine N-acetyltransferase [Terriglobales bacterium]
MTGLYERYLRLLGFREAPSGLDGLRQLVRAHVERVPFENVSKLLLFEKEQRGREIGLSEFLDTIEHQDLGGTCYSCNPFFSELLRQLGYDAALLGADMSRSNVHTSIRVHLDAREYHIDTGYGGPFLEPIPLDALPYEIRIGACRWNFDRAPDGRVCLRVFSGGKQVHGYLVNEPSRDRSFFRQVVEDSFNSGQTFMTVLRLVRIRSEQVSELMNCTFTTHRGNEGSERTLQNMDELRTVVREELGMARCPIERAVGVLTANTQQDFFKRAALEL